MDSAHGQCPGVSRQYLVCPGLLDKDSRKEADLVLHGNASSQPCSKKFVEFLSSRSLPSQYTSYNAPDDNAYVEHAFRTIKEEEIWPNLHDTLGEVRVAIAACVDYYNNERIHLALNYQTPSQVAAALITRAAA